MDGCGDDRRGRLEDLGDHGTVEGQVVCLEVRIDDDRTAANKVVDPDVIGVWINEIEPMQEEDERE